MLLSDCNLCMSDNLIVKSITGLYTVYHFAFLVVSHAWNHSYGFVIVDIEVWSSVSIFFTPKPSRVFTNFLKIRSIPSFMASASSVLSAIARSKSSRTGSTAVMVFLTTVQNQFRLFFQCAFLVVFKLCNRTEQLVFQFCILFLQLSPAGLSLPLSCPASESLSVPVASTGFSSSLLR